MSNCYIYTLTDPNTQKVRYIGKAKNPKDRYSNHINKSRDKNTHKRNWINKLRKNNQKPILEVIEETTNDKWKEREKFWIKYYLDKGNKLVNYTEGGDGLTFGNQTSYKKGDGCKEIVSLDKSGNIHKEFNSIKDAESFFNLAQGTISHVLKKDRKTSCNLIWLYKKDYDNMNISEIKEHIDWALRDDKGINKTSYTPVKIYQYTIDNKFLKEWNSLASVEKELKINRSAICNCAKGRTKSSGGFIWRYEKIKI